MKRFGRVCCALFAATASLSLSSSALATGTISSSLITNIQIVGTTTNPIAVLQTNGLASGTTSCAANPRIGMAIDVSTAKGRAVLSTATAAMLAYKKVTLVGTNSCVAPSGLIALETIDRIQVVN